MRFSRVWLITILSVVASSSVSSATDREVNLCFSYDVQYDDELSGDYYTDNAIHRVADGLYYEVYLRFTTTLVASGWADQAQGCSADLILSDSNYYSIKVVAKAVIDGGHTIFVKNASEQQYAQIVTLSWYPNEGDGDYHFVYAYISEYEVTNAMASLTYSFNKRPAGVSGANLETVVITEGPSRYVHSTGKIYLGEIGMGSKFTAAHELGHRLQFVYNGGTVTCNYGVTGTSPCESGADDHGYNTTEYQTSAATEGFARFYPAAVFNDNSDPLSCDYKGSPCTYYPGWQDHLWNVCGVTNGGRGTEGDWARFWWEMHTEHGLSVEDINAIYAACPNNWTAQSVFDDLYDSAVNGGYVSGALFLSTAQFHGVDL